MYVNVQLFEFYFFKKIHIKLKFFTKFLPKTQLHNVPHPQPVLTGYYNNFWRISFQLLQFF